jgi:DnaJ-domain-containing protein 1
MLRLYNVSIPEETTSLDPEFLMEIMEKNEEIEKASQNIEKMLEFSKENHKILAILTKYYTPYINYNNNFFKFY